MFRIITGVLTCVIFLAACNPFDSDDGRIDSHFEVTIEGEFIAQLEGKATFGTFIDPLTGLRATVIIMIPSSNDQEGINISGLTVDRVEEQSYPVIASLPGSPFGTIEQDEFSASYIQSDGQYSETFQSQVGTITFSNSSENVLQGSFFLEARGYRIVNNENNEQDTVEVWITIEGNFTSVRGELV
jgi:hypothetical protein